jgi:RNA polymerase sigma-70 factor (ECF subfamily)
MFYRLKKLSTPISPERRNTQIQIKLETLDPEISDFLRGNDAAFSSIYKKYSSGIYRFVNSRIRNLELVEELTQEIFLKVFRFRNAYNGNYAFSTWIWTIAKNSIFDHLRGSVQREISTQPSEGTFFCVEDFPCTAKSAESILLEKDQRKVLFRLVKRLTRLQRRVLWFRLVHHLSYDEIARKLGVSVSVVRNIIFRSKIVLKEFGPILILS